MHFGRAYAHSALEMCKTARRPGPAHKSPARGRAGPRHHELWAGPGREAQKSGPGRAGPAEKLIASSKYWKTAKTDFKWCFGVS